VQIWRAAPVSSLIFLVEVHFLRYSGEDERDSSGVFCYRCDAEYWGVAKR
jgi:hypothetical protein